MFNIINEYTQNRYLVQLILTLAGIITGLIVRLLIIGIGKIYLKKWDGKTVKMLFKHLKGTLYTIFPLVFSLILISNYPEKELINAPYIKALQILLITCFAWLVVKLLYFIEELIYSQYDIAKEDNYRERKIITQLQYVRKVAVIVVVIIAASIILLSFDSLKKFGTGLLASAGIASVIIGFAAQKSLANLLAGIQIAFTQPIKIEDAVFVENEWGWIEEINLTYVVIKIWDLRRLILPITYFIENPFQNWTRKEANLLGSVFLYTDFRLPVEELRQELKTILENEPLWDKKAWVLQVSDIKEDTMELRALMTARNSPQTWDLRCSVREKLIKFISEKYPEYLPKSRVFLQNPDSGDKLKEHKNTPVLNRENND
ncbi:mechanosensitive ion channel family protein [Chondrinema litorale]|uniref:mechanosensitive ion channel family protein n=1 Tax=Chondrinema litorale TaxID=2994555 RepID=UPI002542D32F|nr:mechanosensitive ion channel domain-containing protein [Chondrinema litorale]UZR98197.1 mechanosensitive ion channel [Chondrinema litorale]